MIDGRWRAVRRVLAVRLDNLGDALVTTPAIHAIKESLPEAAVTLLHEGHLGEVGAPFKTQQLCVCVARENAAPVCTQAVDIGGTITPEGGSETTWKTKRTATSDGFEIAADGAIPDAFKDAIQRYVVELD